MTDQTIHGRLTTAQIEKILQCHLGKDLIVENCTSAPNTAAGDNYGSLMLALEVTIHRAKDYPSETLHVVAKLPPHTEYMQMVFDFKNTFCKEMNIYRLVAPEFIKLQKESGIPDEDIWNNVAEYYGAQTTLAGDEDPFADLNAALLMKNLKISGYKLADRLAGLDLKHCELTLTKLAHFHALPIALKQKKLDVYEKTVLKAAGHFKLGGGKEDVETDVKNTLEGIKQKMPEIVPYMERMRKVSIERPGNESLKKEPFATIVHNDVWTNNMMFMYDKNSSPTDVKFVDFQTTLLCSPVKDLIFFLFTSITDEVFKNHFDHLVNHYYTNFIDMLKKVRCDTSAFSFQKFQDEINEFAPTQFFHILFMLNVIYIEKRDLQELSEIDSSHEFVYVSGETCRQKMLTLIREFDRRGWL